MALITLQQMYDAWKRVADWVSGANTDKPPVRVTDGTDTMAINPDGSLPVQLTGSKLTIASFDVPRGGSSVARESGGFIDSIGAGATIVLRDVKTPVKIQYLACGMSNPNSNVRLYLYAYNSGGQLRYLPPLGVQFTANSFYNAQYIDFDAIQNNAYTEFGLWKIIQRKNSTNGSVIIELKTPLIFPYGYKMELVNTDQANSIIMRWQQVVLELGVA